jgi:hypothetical protein
MNLFQIATRGIDLDSAPITPDDESPREGFRFEEPAQPQQRLRLPAELDEVFALAAQEYEIDPDVLRGIAYAESRFNQDIISGKVKSKAGAIGLMQFMPETAKEYGIEPTDPTQAIIGAAAYLRKSLDKFGGDYERAVASYNWGPNRKAYDSEDWTSKAPAETQKYLQTVFSAAGRFKDGQAERGLPQGVTPSKAGAGRGVVNPTLDAPVTDTGDETVRLAARYKAPDAPQHGGFIQSVGDFFKPAPTSVQEGYKPTAAEQQAANTQRLRYGAGPIKGDVLVAANEVASGNANSSSPTVNAVAKQMQERGDTFTGYAQSKNTPILKEGARDAKAAEFRSAGEWAVDSVSALAQGSVSIPLLPASIFAPGGDTAKTLRSWRDAWSEQESDVLKAQRAVLKERIQSEEGFAGKYATTVLELVINPALGLSEVIKQVPNYLAVIGASRFASGVVGVGFNAIEKSSPALALANALSSGAVKGGAQATAATAGGMAASVVMTSGDAAGDVYETLTDPNKTPKKVWEQNEDYQALIKQGLSHKAAVMQIAEAKARFAAVVVAPLSPFGFMGAESALATKGIAGLAASFGPKAAAKTFGKEIVGENIEEGGTKWGGNVVTSTVDPRVKRDEGVAEAAATATVTSAPMAGLAARSQLSAPPAQTQDPRNGLIAAGLLDPQTYDGGIVGAAGTANPLLEQLKRKPAPTVESQPTTPQVPPTVTPQAPVTPDAAKTQAVDNIAAAIKELEGGTTQTAPVQPGQQTADTGTAPVAQGPEGASGGLAATGEAAVAGQPESTQSLSVPEKGSAVIPSVETGQSLAQRLTKPATPEQEQAHADTVVAEKAKPAPAYTPAIPQPGQAEAIVGKAVESARKNADLADERMYSVDALQRIAAHPQANAELKSAATNEVQRRAGIEQVKQQQFEARRTGTLLSPLRPLSVERGIEIAKASRERKLLPQEQGYMDALKAEIGDKAFDLVTRAGKAPFMTTMAERKFDLPRLLEQNQSALSQWDTAHNPAQKPTEAPQAAPTTAPAPTIGAEMAALKARSQPAVKMDIAPAMKAAQALAATPVVTQQMTTEAASGVATNPAQAGGKGKKGKQKQVPVVAGKLDTSRQGFSSQTTEVMNRKDSSVAAPDTDARFSPNSDIAKSMPTFKGNKRKMLAMAVSAIKNGMNAKVITQIDDWFGGGGMWSTSLANATLPNVKRIRIAELNPLRIKRIQWMHERGDKLLEDMHRTGALAVYRKIVADLQAENIVSPSPFGDITLELAGFSDKTGSIGWQRAQKSGAFELSEEGKVLLSVLGDLSFGNRGSKIHNQTSLVAPDGQTVGAFLSKAAFEMGEAKKAAQAFKDRSGVYEYFPAGSSYDLVQANAKQGENVLSLADPPYYNTTGYKGAGPFSTGDKWNAKGYAETAKLLKTLVDRGNHVLYTDEAWWLRPDQMEDRLEADAILGQINSTIGNLIVAPEQVGNRYEQLGIHNPGTAVRKSVAASAEQSATRGQDGNPANRGRGGNDGRTGGEVQEATDVSQRTGRDVPDTTGQLAGRTGGQGGGTAGTTDAGIKASRAAPTGATTSTIRTAITKAYGNLLPRLEGKGLVSLTQTEEEAIAAAAQARADQTGGDVEAIKESLRKSVLASVAPQTESENFKRWFGDSQVVDAAGRPLVVFHGSPQGGFDTFDVDNVGAFFSSRYDIAASYAGRYDDVEMAALDEDTYDENQGVYSTYLQIKSPMVVDWGGKDWGNGPDGLKLDDVANRAKRAGHDGLIVENVVDSGWLAPGLVDDKGDGNVYVVFKPEQIKSSTDNNGDFDPSNLDIRRSADGNLEGFFDPATGKSFLIADNLTAESAPGTLMHEVGIHMAAEGKFGPMFDRALTVLNDGSLESTEALRRMQESGETSGEEAAAYLVTVYETNRTNAPASVKQWMKDFIADVRAWLFSKGVLLKADQLTIADIAAVARANARSMARSGPNGGPGGGIRRSFAGEGAATADKMALATARQRVDAGENAETVRKETGWFKGVDGKWRFEINDKKAKLLPKAMQQPGRLNRATEYLRITYGVTYDIGSPKVTDEQMSASLRWADENKGGVLLDEAIQHDALFAAYPSLRSMRVAITSDPKFHGTYSKETNTITISQGRINEADREDRVLSTLLHEIQHGIQNIEGFATGGPSGIKMWQGNMRHIAMAEYQKLVNEVQKPMSVDEYAIKAWNSDVVTDVIRDDYEQNYVPSHIKALKNRGLDRDLQNTAGWNAYKKLAGEVEARNTQARQTMTEDERRATSPNATQDIPDSDVIVVFNGKDAMSAPAPANADPDIRRSVRGGGQQAATQTAPAQPVSKWRDSTGRLQFAPGAMLYDFIGDKASPLLSYLGLKMASPALRTQLRRMKAEVTKAQEIAATVATESAKFSEAERNMVSDLVEKTVAAGTIPPDHAVKMAELINMVMGKQTDELVSLGMLSKDSADRWRDEYLPRYYESKMLKKDAWGEAMKIKGKHLKGRGLFETVPVSQQADYESLGWEVRDDGFDPAKDETVMMWRDFTAKERANMGEIKDAGFRFVMGYMQTQKDIALGRMYRSIASDENLSSRLPTDKMTVKVPDTKVADTSVNVYGELAGRYVSPETLSVLSSQSEAQNDVLAAYRKALGLWKEGKTVLNPVSHMNNVVSNITMAHFAGVSYHRGDKYIGAVRDFVYKHKMVTEAKEAGLFSGGFSESELMQSMPAELRALAGKAESKTDKAINTAMQVMTFGLRNKMQNAYGFEDDFFKYLIYKDARSRGATPDAAVDFAQQYIFTYDDLPRGARIVRDTALPFFSYTYKAMPALLHTALTQPHRFAVPAALMTAAATAAYAIASGDDDDDWYESIQKYLFDDEFRKKADAINADDQKRLPPWMKGYMWTLGGIPRSIRVGYDNKLDKPVFLDVSRMMPGGTLIDVSPNSGGIPLFEGITPSHPMLSIGTAMLGNRDLFTGKDVVDKTDNRTEAAKKRADWMWKQIAPAITVGNYHYERVMNMIAQQTGKVSTPFRDYTGIDRMGMPTLPEYGIPHTFGIKLKPIDLELSEQITDSQNAKLIRELDAKVRSLQRMHRKGAVSDEDMSEFRADALEKRKLLRQGLTIDGDER